MYLLCIAYCGFMKNLFIQEWSMQICLYITWLYIHIYIKPGVYIHIYIKPAYAGPVHVRLDCVGHGYVYGLISNLNNGEWV